MHWAAVWGISIGFSMMVRPTLNYYWIVVLVLSVVIFSRKKAALVFIVSLSAMLIFSGGWNYRNYHLTGFWGLQSITGVTLLWSTQSLTRKSTAEEHLDDPVQARVRDIVFEGPDSLSIMTPARKELGLSPFGLDGYLTKIGIENILENPFHFSRIFIQNFLKTITTFFKFGESAGLASQFPSYLVWMEKISSFLAFFLLPIAAALIIWIKKLDWKFLIFSGLNILYILSLSALVTGTFRYRLPLHPLFWTLDAFIVIAVLDELFKRFRQRNVY